MQYLINSVKTKPVCFEPKQITLKIQDELKSDSDDDTITDQFSVYESDYDMTVSI